ncbi:MAG: efflux RND transporter permease subunit [Sphaerotilus natans]
MTTLAMVFGMVPLAFALSEGAEQRAPMGQAVIGGVITLPAADAGGGAGDLLLDRRPERVGTRRRFGPIVGPMPHRAPDRPPECRVLLRMLFLARNPR